MTLKDTYPVVIIGAGVAGIYQIKMLTDLGIDAVVLEAEADLGGTWYRNRYPGARFDSESYTYGYSFSKELLDEWHWKERFSSQPENLKYLNYVADKFDLRKYMHFNQWVERMDWQEETHTWRIQLAGGRSLQAQYVVTGVGPLSAPTLPRFEGMDDFQGESFHTFYWPSEPVSLQGKRVGIIGTGATGIQIIGEIADKVETLTVFQRRPNWSSPLNNGPISEHEMAQIRARYDEIFANCAKSPGGFEHVPDRRGFWNLTPEERIAFWDELYETPGFAILAGNFVEIYVDEKANQEFSEYIAGRIRQRVNNPDIAEKLIPKDHGFGMQRLPLETRYFEAYNRDNVSLVDLSETPIERVTPAGIETTNSHHDLDLIIYATGFNAIAGAYDRIDIRGVDGMALRDKWKHQLSTFHGVMTHGFPNMLMVAGPQSASGSTNFPRAIEVNVNWLTALLSHVLDKGISRVEPQQQAEADYGDEVVRQYEKLLLRKGRGWFVGYNSNVEGHEAGTVRYPAYLGGGPKYSAMLTQIQEKGYAGLDLKIAEHQ